MAAVRPPWDVPGVGLRDAQLGPQHRRIAHPRQDLPKADRERPYAITTGAALVLFVPAVKSSVNRRGDLSWNRSARGRSGYVSLHAVQTGRPCRARRCAHARDRPAPGRTADPGPAAPGPVRPGAFQGPASTAWTPGGARPATKRPRGAAPARRRRRPGPPPGLRVYGVDSWRSTAGDEAPSRSRAGAPPPSAGTRQTSVTIGVGADASGRAYRIVESSSHSA